MTSVVPTHHTMNSMHAKFEGTVIGFCYSVILTGTDQAGPINKIATVFIILIIYIIVVVVFIMISSSSSSIISLNLRLLLLNQITILKITAAQIAIPCVIGRPLCFRHAWICWCNESISIQATKGKTLEFHHSKFNNLCERKLCCGGFAILIGRAKGPIWVPPELHPVPQFHIIRRVGAVQSWTVYTPGQRPPTWKHVRIDRRRPPSLGIAKSVPPCERMLQSCGFLGFAKILWSKASAARDRVP